MSDGFDPRTVRLTTQIGTDMFTAECMKPGCGWTMHFTWGGSRLSTILEASAEHPCRPEPCAACAARDTAEMGA
jgi:hypothetical protein